MKRPLPPSSAQQPVALQPISSNRSDDFCPSLNSSCSQIYHKRCPAYHAMSVRATHVLYFYDLSGGHRSQKPEIRRFSVAVTSHEEVRRCVTGKKSVPISSGLRRNSKKTELLYIFDLCGGGCDCDRVQLLRRHRRGGRSGVTSAAKRRRPTDFWRF